MNAQIIFINLIAIKFFFILFLLVQKLIFMHLESKDTIVNKPVEELYSYVNEPDKLRDIMPDNINKFEVTDNGFVFSIKGAPMDIALNIKEKVINEKIVLASANSGLDFTLQILMHGLNASQSMVKLLFEGNFNPMIKMMVQKPLQKLVDDMSDKLGQF